MPPITFDPPDHTRYRAVLNPYFAKRRIEEKLEAKADVREDSSKIKFEYRFPLNVTNRPDIAGGVYQKLSALTAADILNVLEMKIKKEKVEIKQKEKKLEKRVKEETEKKEEEIKEKEEREEKKVKEEMKEKEENRQDR